MSQYPRSVIDLMEDRPIANWLRKARDAQLDPATGEPWTQAHLLDVIRDTTGWSLARSLYSRWETGKGTPERKSLAKLIGFWATQGVPGPDAPPAAAEATESGDDLARAIRSL